MVEVRPTRLAGVVEILPQRFGDERGFFSEVYNKAALASHGIAIDFVQDNQSLSRQAGILRGLHYQTVPRTQDKLVRVLRGAAFDVAVDIRVGSPTFGEWVGVVLSADNWNQLLVPKGFAHGFLTLEPDTEVAYKTSDVYAPAHDRAIRFDDPDLAIDWPLPPSGPVLSPKDQAAPWLKEAELFTFESVP